MPPCACATRVIVPSDCAKCSAAPAAAPTPTAENVKRPCDGNGVYIASKVGCRLRRSSSRIAVSAVRTTRCSGTNTSLTCSERLPVPRNPVGVAVVDRLGLVAADEEHVPLVGFSPTGALKISQSVKSEPLQKPHRPVSR